MTSLLGLIAIPFFLALGLVAGFAIAGFHLWATRRAAERAGANSSAMHVLLGMPLRVGVSALAFWLMFTISGWALIGALAAFSFGRGLLLPLFEREREDPREP